MFEDQLRGLSLRQFAERVGISRSRAYIECFQNGNIKYCKSGRRLIIPSTEVEAFLNRIEVKKGGVE